MEKQYWADNSKERKWHDGKGRVRVAWVEWKGKNTIDIRIMRRTDDGYQHTRHGLRITANQLRDLLPALGELLDHIDNHEEEKKRQEPIE